MRWARSDPKKTSVGLEFLLGLSGKRTRKEEGYLRLLKRVFVTIIASSNQLWHFYGILPQCLEPQLEVSVVARVLFIVEGNQPRLEHNMLNVGS